MSSPRQYETTDIGNGEIAELTAPISTRVRVTI